MLLILESFKGDLKQWIEGASFVLRSRLFHSFAPRTAKDFAHMMFSYGVLEDMSQKSEIHLCEDQKV